MVLVSFSPFGFPITPLCVMLCHPLQDLFVIILQERQLPNYSIQFYRLRHLHYNKF